MSLALLVQADNWSAAGHAGEPLWHRVLGTWGPWLLVVVMLALVLRALLHRKRYSAVGVLSSADLDRIHETLRAAERTTIGEIVPVVVERSDAHPGARWLAALTFVLVGTAVLEPHLPWQQHAFVLLAQIALGAAGWGLARALPGFARLFVRESRATAAAEEQATQEFLRLGLYETRAASGVLIFVSLFERRVVVLADRGIDAKVGAEHWRHVDEVVLAGVAGGSLCRGLVEGIERAGAVLGEHFPARADEPNELPDRVIVRRE